MIDKEKSLAYRFPELAKEWHPTKNGNLTPDDVPYGCGKKFWWYLPYDDEKTGKHFDFEWEASVVSRTNRKSGCPQLSGRIVHIGFNDLATTHPELCKEWHPTKNGDLKPTDVTAGAHKDVWWYLEYYDEKQEKTFYFEWNTRITNRTVLKRGCPYLEGKVWVTYNDLATTHPELCKEWHPTKNGDLKPTDVTAGSDRVVWWCVEHYDTTKNKTFFFEWRAMISNRARLGAGCPYTSVPAKAVWYGFNDLATNYPELCKEWNYGRNKIKPTEVSPASNKKVWWKIHHFNEKTGKTHILEWQETVQNRAIGGFQCPYLTNRKVLADFNSLEAMYPEALVEWDYEKNNKKDIYPSKISYMSNKKVWWKMNYIDPETNKKFVFEWEASPYNKVFHGRMCPYLCGQMVHPEFNSLAAKYPDIAKEWHPTKNSNVLPTQVSWGTRKKYWWKIEVDGKTYEWKASVSKRIIGQTHPDLSESHLEKIVQAILENNNFKFKRDRGIKGLVSDKNRPFRFDFILSDENILIECDGIQHFDAKRSFGNKNYFQNIINHDNIKNTFAFSSDIPLLRIPYTYDTNKNRNKIERIVLDFIKTKKIPKEIVDYYAGFDFSNYTSYII